MAQVQDNDDIKWLYGKLKSKGYDIGSEDDFNKSLANEDDRNWYYEKATGMGLDMGTMDDFNSLYAPKQPAQTEATQSKSNVKLEDTAFSMLRKDPSEWTAPKQEKDYDMASDITAPRNVPRTDERIINKKALVDEKALAQQEEDKQLENTLYGLNNPYDQRSEAQRAEGDVKAMNRVQIKELNSKVDSLLASHKNNWNREDEAVKGKDIGFWDAMDYARYPAYIPTNEAEQKHREEYSALYAAKQSLSDAQKIIDEADKSVKEGNFDGFFKGAARGFGDKFFDVRTWDMGLTDYAVNSTLYKALEAADKNEPLTEAQQAMLDAKAVEMATNAYFGSYLGRGYKAGSVTAESLPFMLEMVINPLSAAGKTAQSMLARYALKRFGRDAVRKNIRKYIGGKMLARGVGDVAGAAGMAATTGMSGVVADTYDRMAGTVQFDTDETGRSVFVDAEGGEDFGTAFAKAFAGRAIENHSEMLGAYFAPMLGTAGKYVRKGMDNIGLSRVNKFIDDVAASDVSKMVTDFENQAKYNGVIGEYSEEVLGGIENALIVGDQTLDADKDTGVFNLDNNIDTFLGVGLMGGFFSGVKTFGYRTPKYRAREEMVNADKRASTVFGNQDRWGAIRNTVAFGNEEEVHNAIADALRDNSLTTEQKRAVLNYAKNAQRYRGMILAEQKRREDEHTDPLQTDVETSFDNGYTLSGAQEMNDARNMLMYRTTQMRDAFGLADGEEERFLETLGDGDPVMGVSRLQSDLTPERAKAAVGYLNAKATYEGMIQRVRDGVQERTAESEMLIESRMNRNSGMIQPATMKVDDRKVYVVAGNVVPYSAGTGVNLVKSDGSLIVRDAQTGNYESISPKALLSLDPVQNPEELKQEARQTIVEEYARQEADKIDGVATFNPGDTYTVTAEDGAQAQVTVTANEQGIIDNGDGTVNVTFGNEIVPMAKDELQQAADAANMARLEEFEAQRAAENAVQGNETVAPRYEMGGEVTFLNDNGEEVRARVEHVGPDGVLLAIPIPQTGFWNTVRYVEEELNSRLTSYNGEEIARPSVATTTEAPAVEASAEVVPAQEATALERIPKDEKGEPIYEQAESPDLAWDALVEQAEGDEAMAQEVANDMVADSKKAVEKAKKLTPKARTTTAEKMAARKGFKTAIEASESQLAMWQEIAGTAKRRADAVEAERKAAEAERRRIIDEQAALRRAEEEKLRAEQEEAARIEREALNGVPDMADDTPQDARARGYRRLAGHKVDRQQPILHLQGKKVEVKFSDEALANGRVAVIDAAELQPSHIQGMRNPAHFIDEAQPKERNDEVSVMSARKIAGNIRPEEITTSVTAYTGAPTVNARGEVIQGNNRSAALRLMWESEKEQAAIYKQYLKEHADEFGLNADEIEAMQSPVLVNMLDVDDADAITLGQFVAQDTESGGIERIKPKNAVQKMGADMRSFANLLLRSTDDETSFAGLVDSNGAEVLNWMNRRGFITPTQYKSAFDSKGAITAEAKNDLKGIMYQSIFQGGNTRLEEMFNAMPAKAQRAILATAFRDYDSPNAERMVEEIQNSIRAYNALSQDAAFASAKNWKEARNAVEGWKRQYAMDDVTGESYFPADKFSNFALHLATMYKGESQSLIQSTFNHLYDLIQGTQEETLFEKPDNTPRSLAQAIKEALNIDYNGQQRSNVLAGDSSASQQGQQGSDGTPAPRERIESGEQATDGTGGTESGSGRSGDRSVGGESQGETPSTAQSEEKLTKEEATELVAEMEERATVAPDIELTIENWDSLFGEEAKVDTPIGEVKMGENQFTKLMRQGRDSKLGMIKPTLETPDVIIEDDSVAKDGDITERPSSYVFVKTFRKADGSRYYYFTSITVSKDGHEVVISNQEKRKSIVMNLLINGKLVWKHADDVSAASDVADGLYSSQGNLSDPATEGTDAPQTKVSNGEMQNPKKGGAQTEQRPADVSVTAFSGNSQGISADKVTPSSRNEQETEIVSSGNDVNATLVEQIEAAEAETETNPTEAQKEAGNYKKGHVRIDGFDVTIENPKGSERSGTDAKGNKWSVTMHNTYGYIRGTEGVDGDHIDVFLSENPEAGDVFVIDQVNADGSFDEHKVMYGFTSEEEARTAYLSNYSPGWTGLGAITHVSKDEFKKWVNFSHRKTKPFAEYKSVRKKGALDVELEWQEKIQDYIFEHYPTQATLTANSTSPKGLEERAAMKNDETLRKMYEDAEREFNEADEAERAERNAQLQVEDSSLTATESQQVATEAVLQMLSDAGVEVVMDARDMAEVLEANERLQEMKKSVLESTSALQGEHHPAVTSSSDGAKVLNKIRNSKSAEITGDEITPREDLKQYKRNALEYGKTLRGEYTNADTGKTVLLGKNGIKEVLQHDYKDVEQLQSIAAIPQIIENGIYIGSEANKDVDKNPKITEYEYYVCGMRIGEEDYTVRSVYGLDDKGNRYYDHKLTHIEKGKLLDSLFGITNPGFSQATNEVGFGTTPDTKSTTDVSVGKDKKLISLLKGLAGENDNTLQFLRTKRGEVYGFVKDGRIYLDAKLLNPNTPIHEYTHLWDAALREKNPELWRRGVGLMKETSLWREIVENPAYADIAEDENLVASEVHARLTGKEGAALLERLVREARETKGGAFEMAEKITLIEELRRWLRDAWQWVKDTMTPWTREEASAVTLEEFVNMPIKDLAEGKRLEGETTDAVQYRIPDESSASRRGGDKQRAETNHVIDSAVAFVTGKTENEVRKERQLREQQCRDEAKEIYEKTLSGDFNEVTLQKINDYIDEFTPDNPYGRRISQRLPQKVERKLRGRERTNSFDALASRIAESAVQTSKGNILQKRREVAKIKQQLLEGYAKANGIWFTNIDELDVKPEPIDQGTDSMVYASNDGNYVIKLSKGKHGRKFESDIDAANLFNGVFYNTPYDIIGYGNINGSFVTILKQPAVEFSTSHPEVNEQERVDFMRYLGFEPRKGQTTLFSNGELIVSDLQKSNIVRDANGNIRVIDADVKLHTKDIGGKYSYPPATVDIEDRRQDGKEENDNTLLREGEGAVSDETVGYENDPVSKVVGRSIRSKSQQKLFVERMRRNMRREAERIAKLLGIEGDVEILDEYGADKSNKNNRNNKSDRKARAKGFFDKKSGKITIILGNHNSIGDVETTMLHEAVAHYGLRKLFGKQFDQFLWNVFNNASPEVRREITALMAKHGWDYRVATEEYLAGLAEDTNYNNVLNSGWWGKIKRMFIDMLRSIGWDYKGPELTDNELRYILWRSYENLREPGGMRSILGEAEDVAMQYELGVGNYAPASAPLPVVAEENSELDVVNVQFNERLAGLTEEKVDFVLNPSDLKHIYNEQFEANEKDTGNNIALTIDDIRNMVDVISSPDYVVPGVDEKNGKKMLYFLKDGQNGTYNLLEIYSDRKGNLTAKTYYKTKKTASQRAMSLIDSLHSTSETVGASLSEAKVGKLFELPNEDAENNAEDGVLFRESTPADAVPSSPKSASGIATELYERSVAGWLNNFKEAWHDQLRSIKKAQEAIEAEIGRKLNDFENVYLHALHKSSVDMEEWSQAMKRFVEPLTDAVFHIVDGKRMFDGREMTQDDLEIYLNCKHAPERNEYIARRKAQEAFDAYKEGHPEDEEKTLDDFYRMYRNKDQSGLTEIFAAQNEGRKVDAQLLEEQAADYVRRFEAAAGEAHIKELWDRVHAMNNFSLEKSYLSGLISREQYDSTRSMYEYYVPLRGFHQETAEDVYDYITRDAVPVEKVMKKAGGRTSRAKLLLATMMNMGHSAIVMGNKNLMKQKMLTLALNTKTPLLSVSNQWYVKNVFDEWEPAQEPYFDENTPQDEARRIVEEWERQMEELETEGKTTRWRKGLNVKYRVGESYHKNEHAVKVLRNGQEYIVWVNANPKMAQAVNGMLNPDAGKTGALIKGMNRLNRFRAKGLTALDPEFMIRNFKRDLISGNMTTLAKHGGKYLADFDRNVTRLLSPLAIKQAKEGKFSGIYALYHRYRNDKLDMNDNTDRMFAEFMKNGGQTGYSHMWQIDDYQNNIQKVLESKSLKRRTVAAFDAVGDLFEIMNQGVENTCRFAAYMTARQHGMTVLDSVAEAKEVSVNFNSKGSGRMGNEAARAVFMFLNPSIQGFTQHVELIKNHPKRMIPIDTAFLAMGAMIPMVYQMFFNGGDGDDDEEGRDSDYWKLSAFSRRNNLNLRAGKDKYIKIDLPHELRTYYGLGEICASIALGKMDKENATMAIVSQLTQAVPLNPINSEAILSPDDTVLGGAFKNLARATAAGPVLEAYQWNEDFTGRQIAYSNDFNKYKPEWQKASRNTPEVLVDVSRWLNSSWLSGGKRNRKGLLDFNPSKAQHAVESYFGGRIGFYTKLYKTVETLFSDDEEARKDYRNYLFLGTTYTDTSSDYYTYRRTNDLWKYYKEESEETTNVLNSNLADEHNGIFGAAEAVDKMYASGEIERRDIFKDYNKSISALYDEAESFRDRDVEKFNSIMREVNELKKEAVQMMLDTEK